MSVRPILLNRRRVPFLLPLPRPAGERGENRMTAKRVLIACAAFLLLAGFAYAGLCLWFTVNERSLVFYPMQRASIAPQAAGLKDVAEVNLAAEDGERLYGWWAPPRPGHGPVGHFTAKALRLSAPSGLFPHPPAPR